MDKVLLKLLLNEKNSLHRPMTSLSLYNIFLITVCIYLSVNIRLNFSNTLVIKQLDKNF